MSNTADPRPALGIICILLAALLIPLADAIAKILTTKMPTLEALWLRYLGQTLVLLPIVLFFYGRRAFQTKTPGLQALRSLLIGISAFLFYTALSRMPLADAVAVFFISPFVVTALSPVVLGERVGAWRWTAVAAGFIGAMVIIRPGFETVGIGTIAAVTAGVSFALFVLATRRLAGGDPALVTTFLTGLGVSMIAAIPMPFVWQPPSTDDLFLVVCVGVVGSAFGVLIVLAYQYASASQLAPFGYAELAAAALFGWLIFGDVPDLPTWIGIAIITASGLIIAWREGVRGSARRVGAVRKPPVR